MDHFVVKNSKGGARGCSFEDHNDVVSLIKEGKIQTPICGNCRKPHLLTLAEFDAVEIKEAIRVIDYNRDRLIGIITRLLDGTIKRQEHEALRETLKSIYLEMNDVVRMICAQNDLYGCRETLLGEGRIMIVKI